MQNSINESIIKMQQEQNTLSEAEINDNVSELQYLLSSRESQLSKSNNEQSRINNAQNIIDSMLANIDDLNAPINHADEVDKIIEEGSINDTGDDTPVHAACAFGRISFRPTNITSPLTEKEIHKAIDELHGVLSKLGCEVEFEELSMANVSTVVRSKHTEL